DARSLSILGAAKASSERITVDLCIFNCAARYISDGHAQPRSAFCSSHNRTAVLCAAPGRELVTRKRIKHRLRWLGLCLKHEAFTIEHHRDGGFLRGAKGLTRAHSRPLQLPLHSPRAEL